MENTIPTRKETKALPKSDGAEHRYEHGQTHSHNVHDPNDQYSLGDRAKLEKKLEAEDGKATGKAADTPAAGWWELDSKPRPTQIAERHGNKPSRGAQIDEQIENEEIEELKRKGKI